MLQLHYHPGNANLAPHVLLEEIGAPFELVFVDRANAAHKSPAYLKLNPNGQIPVLVDGDFVVYESAAICLYLADRFPDKELVPPLQTRERAHFYQWLIWCTNTLQAMLMHFFYPERMVDEADAAAAAQVKRSAEMRVGSMLDQLEQQARHARRGLAARPSLQRRRSVCAHAVPLDTQLHTAGAQPPVLGVLPTAHACAPSGAADVWKREAVNAIRLSGSYSDHKLSSSIFE